MAGVPKKWVNVRDAVASQSEGEEGGDNSFISGESGETKAERETNKTEQYWTGGGPEYDKDLGGEARNK